jgi:hypothetical protein
LRPTNQVSELKSTPVDKSLSKQLEVTPKSLDFDPRLVSDHKISAKKGGVRKKRIPKGPKGPLPSVPHNMSSPPHVKLRGALDILQNNRKPVIEGGRYAKHLLTQFREQDCKVLPSNVESYDPNVMLLAQSMVALDTVYEFRLTNFLSGGINSSGAGVIAGYQNADPSGGAGSTWTASEWSALISLFSEVKMKKFSLRFCPFNNSNGNTKFGGHMVISGVLSTIAAAPTTYAQVWDNADATQFQIVQSTAKSGKYHAIEGTGLSWAVVTTPNPGSYAGCPGGIQYYASGMVATTGYADLLYEGFYLFRSRI